MDGSTRLVTSGDEGVPPPPPGGPPDASEAFRAANDLDLSIGGGGGGGEGSSSGWVPQSTKDDDAFSNPLRHMLYPKSVAGEKPRKWSDHLERLTMKGVNPPPLPFSDTSAPPLLSAGGTSSPPPLLSAVNSPRAPAEVEDGVDALSSSIMDFSASPVTFADSPSSPSASSPLRTQSAVGAGGGGESDDDSDDDDKRFDFGSNEVQPMSREGVVTQLDPKADPSLANPYVLPDHILQAMAGTETVGRDRSHSRTLSPLSSFTDLQQSTNATDGGRQRRQTISDLVMEQKKVSDALKSKPSRKKTIFKGFRNRIGSLKQQSKETRQRSRSLDPAQVWKEEGIPDTGTRGIRIFLSDGSYKTVRQNAQDTVGDIVRVVADKIGLKDPSDYSLFDMPSGSLFGALMENEEPVPPDAALRKIVFRKRVIWPEDERTKDRETLHMVFIQTVYNVRTGVFKLSDSAITCLAAAQLQVQFGTAMKKKVEKKFVREKLDDFVPPQVIADKSAKKWEEEIMVQHNYITTYDSLRAQWYYVDYVKKSTPVFGSCFFEVQQTEWRELSTHLIAGISNEGLCLINELSHDIEVQHDLRTLMEWGHTPGTFFYVVGNEKVTLETTQGREMVNVLNEYVNRMVRKLAESNNQQMPQRPAAAARASFPPPPPPEETSDDQAASTSLPLPPPPPAPTDNASSAPLPPPPPPPAQSLGEEEEEGRDEELEEEWFYNRGEEHMGPVTLECLQAMAKEGKEVNRATYCWCEGMDTWYPMPSVSVFKDIFR